MQILLLAVLTMVVPVCAHSEGVPMAGVLSIDFEKDKVGIVAIETNNWKAFGNPDTYTYYHELDPKTASTSEKTREAYYQRFLLPKEPMETDIYIGGKVWPSVSQDGTDFKAFQSKCEAQDEGDPICKSLTIKVDGKKIEIGKEDICRFGCRVRAIEKWDDQVWVGLFRYGELQPSGEGLYIWDQKTFKNLHARKTFLNRKAKSSEDSDLIPTIMKKNPDNTQMWVGTNRGILVFNKKFEVLIRCFVVVSTKEKKFSLSCEKISDR